MRTRQIGIWLLMCFGLWFVWGCQPKQKKKEDPPVSVEVGKVSQGSIKEYVTFTGDIEGEASVRVYSLVSDRIQSLRVDVGDVVKKGQMLAVIEHTRLYQAVAQAQAQLAATRAQLAGAEVSLAGAKVSEASSKREYLRLKKLLRSGAVGGQQVDMAKAQYDGSIMQVRAAYEQIRALRSQIRALQAGVAQARVGRSSAIIQAPISGLVSQRFRQAGDMNLPQMPIIEIVRMDRVKVAIQLTEENLSKVRLEDRAEISVVGYPGRVFVGSVTKLSPTLDMETRTAAAEIEIDNVYPIKPLKKCRTQQDCKGISNAYCYRLLPSHSADRKTKSNGKKDLYCVEKHPLKPGMIAKVRSLVKIHNDALLIPSSAILNDSYGYGRRKRNQMLAVLTLDANNQPERRNVRVGLESEDGRLQIVEGLRLGERLIIRGHNLFRTGRKIKIVREEGGTHPPASSPPRLTAPAKPTMSSNTPKKTTRRTN